MNPCKEKSCDHFASSDALCTIVALACLSISTPTSDPQVAYHEHFHNPSLVMKIGTHVSLLLLASGCLLAPCALVPNTREYWDGFNGAMYLQLMFIFWFVWNTMLLLQYMYFNEDRHFYSPLCTSPPPRARPFPR